MAPGLIDEHSSIGPRLGGAGSRRRRNGFLAFGILLIAAFAKPLTELAMHVAHSDLHSHILLVPFISAYLISLRRQQLPEAYRSSLGWAIFPFLAGGAAVIAAWMLPAISDNDYLSLMAFAFVCLLVAGGFFFLGRKWMAAAAFPFAFLIFMVPLPDGAVDWLETASKLASTEVASFFLNITGSPVFREGTVFQLPGISLQVAQECSGIRSSWVLFITGLLAANLFLKGTWHRIVLVAFVIPLGIIRNGFRILVIALLCIQVGPEMIHSVIHTRGGPLFFSLSLVPLFLLLWWLRCREARAGR